MTTGPTAAPFLSGTVEARALAKAGRRIIPFVMLLYFVAFIDRVNIGFAALTMNRELGFSDEVFGFAASIFFIGYFLFEVPSNLVLHRIGARIWIARVMIIWGLISGAMALVQGAASFYALRFLLGAAEAGFFPGIILYLSYWFPARRRAGVTALFLAAAPLSTALGSPVSAALLTLDGALGLSGWQWLFLAEALPAVILGIVVLFYLTDRPEQAKWLDDDERDWLVGTLAAEQAGLRAASGHQTWRGLADLRVLALGLIYFGTSAGLYALSIWSPQIIRQFGLTTLQTGFLNVIPAGCAVIAMVLWARHSDRSGERIWHVVGPCLLAAGGLVYVGSAATIPGVLIALSLVNIGISAAKAPLWSLPTLFLSGSAAAAGIALINAIGNLGGFAGPYLIGWIKDQTGSFRGGLYAVAGLLLVSALLTLILAHSQQRAARSAVSSSEIPS
jgi:ACS family tartrate transporter-like MFS transporter